MTTPDRPTPDHLPLNRLRQRAYWLAASVIAVAGTCTRGDVNAVMEDAAYHPATAAAAVAWLSRAGYIARAGHGDPADDILSWDGPPLLSQQEYIRSYFEPPRDPLTRRRRSRKGNAARGDSVHRNNHLGYPLTYGLAEEIYTAADGAWIDLEDVCSHAVQIGYRASSAQTAMSWLVRHGYVEKEDDGEVLVRWVAGPLLSFEEYAADDIANPIQPEPQGRRREIPIIDLVALAEEQAPVEEPAGASMPEDTVKPSKGALDPLDTLTVVTQDVAADGVRVLLIQDGAGNLWRAERFAL